MENSRAIHLLRWFCPPHLLEEIEGDLLQKFEKDVENFGDRRARRRLVWNTVRYFRPGIVLRNDFDVSLNSMYMFRNYFKVASRVMVRNKSFSLINIFGLTLGLSGALLLFLWIVNEFSYDRFHADKERIYTVWNRDVHQGQIECSNHTPRVLSPTLRTEFAAVEAVASFAAWEKPYLLTHNENKLMNKDGVFVDADFLSILSFPLLKGDAASALSEPSSIVLTETLAKKLFGDKEALGEEITLKADGYTIPFTITGILHDLPANTDFRFEYLLPWRFIELNFGEDTFWGNNSVITLVKLKAGVDSEQFAVQIKDLKKKNRQEETAELFLHPITKNRLYSKFENGVQSGGRIEIIRMLGILGVCLILIACINYVNLSTARAQKRSKEVGIRKVNGAHRPSIILQFLCESVLIAILAGIVSLGIVYIALPAFGTLVQQPLGFAVADLNFWIGIAFVILFIGILAGGYPAFYLSAFNPVRILKGAPITSSGRNVLRQVLVVFQFGFAITLIVSVIVVHKQIGYVQNRDAGYAKDGLIYQPLSGDLLANYQAYKNELLSSGASLSVTKSGSPITEVWSGTTEIRWRGKDPNTKIAIERFDVDGDIVATAGLTLLEGRDISLTEYPSDSTAVLLNETAMKAMSFTEPIGEIIVDDGVEYHVVGVVKDFVLTSPYQKIAPMVLQGPAPGRNLFEIVHIKLNPNLRVQDNLKLIASLNSKYNPDFPFEYEFVDLEYKRKFADLETTLTITGIFSSMAICIACLGLLGLSTFMIESRVKEIGIRKVLGASVTGITRLLCWHSIRPISLAVLIFSPVAWWAMNWWLQSFDYRIEMSFGYIVLSALALILLAIVTVVGQTIHAAGRNPVNSLRSE
ncbi:MAG: ABC transporter permease [Cyclobacteriaceae bacterium]|nr:ABC transporter permease [Cyclobacteriaceae bacterium]